MISDSISIDIISFILEHGLHFPVFFVYLMLLCAFLFVRFSYWILDVETLNSVMFLGRLICVLKKKINCLDSNSQILSSEILLGCFTFLLRAPRNVLPPLHVQCNGQPRIWMNFYIHILGPISSGGSYLYWKSSLLTFWLFCGPQALLSDTSSLLGNSFM